MSIEDDFGTNAGHGWVWERPDGMKAKCGGPGVCLTCAADERALLSLEPATETERYLRDQIVHLEVDITAAGTKKLHYEEAFRHLRASRLIMKNREASLFP